MLSLHERRLIREDIDDGWIELPGKPRNQLCADPVPRNGSVLIRLIEIIASPARFEIPAQLVSMAIEQRANRDAAPRVHSG